MYVVINKRSGLREGPLLRGDVTVQIPGTNTHVVLDNQPEAFLRRYNVYRFKQISEMENYDPRFGVEKVEVQIDWGMLVYTEKLTFIEKEDLSGTMPGIISLIKDYRDAHIARGINYHASQVNVEGNLLKGHVVPVHCDNVMIDAVGRQLTFFQLGMEYSQLSIGPRSFIIFDDVKEVERLYLTGGRFVNECFILAATLIERVSANLPAAEVKKIVDSLDKEFTAIANSRGIE